MANQLDTENDGTDDGRILSHQLAHAVSWAWRDKGDPSRTDYFEEACNKCPALLKAYNDWKASEQVLDLVIEGLINQ